LRVSSLLAICLLPFALAGCSAFGGATVEDDVEEISQDVAEEVLDPKTNFVFEIDAPDSLLTLIREQTYLGRWQRRSDYDKIQFPGLVARLDGEVQQILQSRGYFKGSSKVEQLPRGIKLVVSAGARTTVNLVEIKMDGPAEGIGKVREFALARWSLPEGSFFDSELWQKGKRNIVETLHQQGYLRARIVQSQARIDRKLTAAGLSLHIDSGPRIGFGDVKVIGLSRYDESIVQNLRPFRKGEPYTLDAMVLYQARIRATGYFSDASVVPELTELEDNIGREVVNLTVNVLERETKRAVFGLGYSTDEGVRGQIGLEHRNLFGKGWKLESALVASVKRQRAFANVRTPLSRTNNFWGFGGRVEREDIEGQISTRSNTYFGRGKVDGDIESFTSLQYQIERQRLEPSGLVKSQRALVLGHSWNLRRLDSTVDPRKGYTISAQVSGAKKGVATDASFVRFYLRAMRFFPLPANSRWRNGTIVALAELGLVNTKNADEIPTENLFRTGGSQTVRGYRYESLGVANAGSVTGGRYLAVASLEYQHRMSDLYSLAAFFDYGNASASKASLDPVIGYGIGVRFRTPVGPINLDLAYGDALKRWRAHFSVGYTF